MRRPLFAVLFVLAASAAMSFAGWWSLVSPTAAGYVPLALVKTINLPPAIAGIVVGRNTRGNLLSAVIRDCDFCTPREHMISYFSVAIPGYVSLFGGVAALIAWRKWRRAAAA